MGYRCVFCQRVWFEYTPFATHMLLVHGKPSKSDPLDDGWWPPLSGERDSDGEVVE